MIRRIGRSAWAVLATLLVSACGVSIIDCPDCPWKGYGISAVDSTFTFIDTAWMPVHGVEITLRYKSLEAGATDCIPCEERLTDGSLVSDRPLLTAIGDTLPAGTNLMDSAVAARFGFARAYGIGLSPGARLAKGRVRFEYRGKMGNRPVTATGSVFVAEDAGF